MFLKSQPANQPVSQHMNSQSTSGHLPAQNAHPEVGAALAEIRVFAGQMQEMTTLFRRGQADMTRQMELTTLRLDKAAETVALGEAKVAAQIATFERKANEARRSTEEHERTLRDAVEQMRRTATEFSNEAAIPLRTEVDGIVRTLNDAHSRLTVASDGIAGAASAAAGVISAKGQEALQQQSERVAEFVTSAVENAETRLKATTEALDQSSGALSHRIRSAASAQDAKTNIFQAAVKKLEAISVGISDNKAQTGAHEETARRLNDASLAINVAASKIIGAVIEMKNDKASPVSHKADAALVAHKTDVDAVMTSIEAALARIAAERSESTTEVLVRMDQLQEVFAEKLSVTPPVMMSDLPALDVEREAMKRLTIGYRLMMRDVGKENQRLETLVQSLSDSIKLLHEKVEATPTPAIAVLALGAATDEKVEALEKLGSEKVSFQRLLVGFRLLMRDISSEAARLRTTIDGVASAAIPQEKTKTDHAPSLAQVKLEELVGTLGAVAVQLNERVQVLSRIEAEKPEVRQPEAMVLSLPEPKDNAALPLFNSEKDSVQRLLVGFRLLLRDIGLETAVFRSKIADIHQPEMLVLSPAIDAEALAPLNATAERIAEGVAETLALLEQRMAEPLGVLNTAVAESANILKLAHTALLTPVPVVSAPTMPAGMPPKPLPEASLMEAVSAMQGAATSIDLHIGHVDQLLTTLKRGGALSSETLRDIVTNIDAATSSLRAEASDFLAIGAALSRDLEMAAGVEDSVPQPRRIRSLANMKKRTA